MAVQLTIKSLAAKTGLPAHTIRAWEKRYGALSPARSDTNRRLYDEADVLRLTCLRRAVETGHSIGQVAHLPTEELELLARREASPAKGSSDLVRRCVDAVVRLDASSLEGELVRAAASMGVAEMIEGVVIPLIHQLDVRWADGSLRIAQEHLASATLRTHLERVRSSLPVPPGAPRLIVTTPSGQVHELGALIVGVMASLEGWNVLYLGPNMPAEDIADASRQFHASAVGLSLVYPTDDPRIEVELLELRRMLGAKMPVLVGGRAAGAYEKALAKASARQITGVQDLKSELERLRGEAA